MIQSEVVEVLKCYFNQLHTKKRSKTQLSNNFLESILIRL